MRQPNWSRDELILALDLYFSGDAAKMREHHPGVVQLSELLRQLNIHPGPHDGSFRNPGSVKLKLNNFLSIDPNYPGTGLEAVGRGDRAVWDEFANDQERLRRLAAGIRANAGTAQPDSDADEVDDFEVPEGRVLFRVHRARERDRSLVTKKIKQVMKANACLQCEVCGVEPGPRYGVRSEGLLECHHRVPLSTYRPGQITRLQDLVIVCPTCHRALHRASCTVESLRDRMRPRASIAKRFGQLCRELTDWYGRDRIPGLTTPRLLRGAGSVETFLQDNIDSKGTEHMLIALSRYAIWATDIAELIAGGDPAKVQAAQRSLSDFARLHDFLGKQIASQD